MALKTSIVIEKLPNSNQLQDARQLITQAINLIDEGMISMSDEDRKSSRSISEGREGIVDETLRVAMEFEEVLPRNLDLKIPLQLLGIFKELKRFSIFVEKLAEKVDDTVLGTGIELMHYSDIIQNNLQVARKFNTNLDRALQGIDNYNSRFGKRTESTNTTENEIPPPVA